jgi:hypothetical protein
MVILARFIDVDVMEEARFFGAWHPRFSRHPKEPDEKHN